MASVRKEVLVDARPEEVWEALRAWYALHERLVPGFVADTRIDGDDRIVTFSNGVVVREVLVDLDEEARRFVWSIIDGPYRHHNGAAQVLDAGDGRTHIVCVAGLLLPDCRAPATSELVEHGTRDIKRILEARAVGL